MPYLLDTNAAIGLIKGHPGIAGSRARSSMRRAATRPASSGRGCTASTTSMRRHATAWPKRVTTSPESGPSQWCATVRAVAAEALPAPTTSRHPAGGSGRFGGTQRAGCGLAMAASNSCVSSERGEHGLPRQVGFDPGGGGPFFSLYGKFSTDTMLPAAAQVKTCPFQSPKCMPSFGPAPIQ